jgi:hypothetical protein
MKLWKSIEEHYLMEHIMTGPTPRPDPAGLTRLTTRHDDDDGRTTEHT